MQNWKRALLAGCAGASAVMFYRSKPAAGILLAEAGLVVLASEYPEEFAEVREVLPEYVERAVAALTIATKLGKRLAEASADGHTLWS